VDLLSALRLGVNVGLVEDVPLEKANELFVIVHPGHLQKIEGRTLTPGERDVARARLLRERLC
jgi:protein arginine kinase